MSAGETPEGVTLGVFLARVREIGGVGIFEGRHADGSPYWMIHVRTIARATYYPTVEAAVAAFMEEL